MPKTSSYSSCLIPLCEFSMEQFRTNVRLQEPSNGRETIAPDSSVFDADGLKPAKIFYLLIDPEAENKFTLLRGGDID